MRRRLCCAPLVRERMDSRSEAGRGVVSQSQSLRVHASWFVLAFFSLGGLRELRGRGKIDDPQRGADTLGGAVLETDHGIDRNVGLAAIDRVDDVSVFLADHAAADFSGAG